MAAQPNPENFRLYQVDFSELQKTNEFNTRLKENLAGISNNMFDSSYLKKLSTDSRALLYVLADPSWNILCALEVYLEGNIPAMSNDEDMAFGTPMHKGFHYFRTMLPETLYGARIITLFPLLQPQQPQEHDYTSIALVKLIRFLKEGVMDENLREEGSLVKLKKSWPVLHYVGICWEDINDVRQEEFIRLNSSFGFSPLFAGHMENAGSSLSSARNNCAMVLVKMWEVYDRNQQRITLSNIAKETQRVFFRLLRYGLRDLSPSLALRIIKSFTELKDKTDQCQKLWDEFDDLQLVSHLVLDFGVYFLDKIPAILTEQEETILLEMCGKMKTPYEAATVLNLTRPNAMNLIASCFEKVQHYFNNLTPEVIDPNPRR